MLTSLVVSCVSLKPSEDVSKNIILGRYLEYILIIENGDIAQKASDFLSADFYGFAKDELKNKIDLTQRGTIQFTYMPLGKLKGYSFKVADKIFCLKLDGVDINQRKVSILLDYILEGGLWKIDKVYTVYLESDPYDSAPTCAADDDLLKPL